MLCFSRASYDVLKNKLKLVRNVDLALAWLAFFGLISYWLHQLIFTETSTTSFWWDCLLVVGYFCLIELVLASILRSIIEMPTLGDYKLWFWMRIVMEAITICLFLGVIADKQQRSIHNVHSSGISNFGLLIITLRSALIPYRIYELLLLKDFRKYIGTIEVSPTPADIENPGNPTFSNSDGGDATEPPLPGPQILADFLRNFADRLEQNR